MSAIRRNSTRRAGTPGANSGTDRPLDKSAAQSGCQSVVNAGRLRCGDEHSRATVDEQVDQSREFLLRSGFLTHLLQIVQHEQLCGTQLVAKVRETVRVDRVGVSCGRSQRHMSAITNSPGRSCRQRSANPSANNVLPVPVGPQNTTGL